MCRGKVKLPRWENLKLSKLINPFLKNKTWSKKLMAEPTKRNLKAIVKLRKKRESLENLKKKQLNPSKPL